MSAWRQPFVLRVTCVRASSNQRRPGRLGDLLGISGTALEVRADRHDQWLLWPVSWKAGPLCVPGFKSFHSLTCLLCQ